MKQVLRLLGPIVETTAIATAMTSLVAAILGDQEEGSAAGPINAISHIAFGDEAADQDDPSLKYTGVGAIINAAALSSWALVHEFLVSKLRIRRPVAALAAGSAVSALAYVTDYHLVPKRLTPGFEKRLSSKGMFLVYATLAASLAAGTLLRAQD